MDTSEVSADKQNLFKGVDEECILLWCINQHLSRSQNRPYYLSFMKKLVANIIDLHLRTVFIIYVFVVHVRLWLKEISALKNDVDVEVSVWSFLHRTINISKSSFKTFQNRSKLHLFVQQ